MNFLCPLASGSKGNAFYFGTDQTKLLIDIGISYKRLIQRLAEIKISIHEIDAVLISHEHSDHIRGLEQLCRMIKVPIFANSETAKAILSTMSLIPRFKIFSTGEMFEFGNIEIHPFSVQHDTLDPVAFTLKCMEIKVGVCTDLGYVTTLVTAQLRDCNYLYLESNHEPSMVYACPRSSIYKNRVLGRQGHLSNEMCSNLIKQIKHSNLKHVYLAHLSQECNHPKVALKKVREHLEENISLSIAYQDRISDPIVF